MLKKFCINLLKLNGWTLAKGLPEGVTKCVVIAAPHTSNWDFYYMRVSFFGLEVPIRVTIKESIVNSPLGFILRPMGAIAIVRSQNAQEANRKSYVDVMADIVKENDPIALVVTPEGTRARRTEWKSGFYHVAKQAGVPIALGYLDYKKKEAGIGPLVYPTDDIDADMAKIMAFYKGIHGKYPEDFSVDQRYDK